MTSTLRDDVSALFVESDGIYPQLLWNWWDIRANACRYRGPRPVVAHPPCARWCVLAKLVQSLYGHKVGDDGGCFSSAIRSVETYGGILEHPAGTLAFSHFNIRKPVFGVWLPSSKSRSWVTELAQSAYGHQAQKLTWIYACGFKTEPPNPIWKFIPGKKAIGPVGKYRKRHDNIKETLNQKESLASPLAFAEWLIEVASKAKV